MIAPRLLTKTQAVEYAAGGSVRRFDRWRQAGLMPSRVPGTAMFDRLALDAAIDKLTGTVAARPKADEIPAAEDLLEAWKKKRDERRNRGR